jgi:hypothetical protein
MPETSATDGLNHTTAKAATPFYADQLPVNVESCGMKTVTQNSVALSFLSHVQRAADTEVGSCSLGAA